MNPLKCAFGAIAENFMEFTIRHKKALKLYECLTCARVWTHEIKYSPIEILCFALVIAIKKLIITLRFILCMSFPEQIWWLCHNKCHSFRSPHDLVFTISTIWDCLLYHKKSIKGYALANLLVDHPIYTHRLNRNYRLTHLFEIYFIGNEFTYSLSLWKLYLCSLNCAQLMILFHASLFIFIEYCPQSQYNIIL